MSDLIDDFAEPICFGLLGLCFLGLFGFLVYGIYACLDDWLSPTQMARGRVEDVSFRAERAQETLILVGKTMMPQVQLIPDKWFLNICVRNACDTLTISHAPWTWEQKGQPAEVYYYNGAFSGAFGVSAIAQP